MITLKSVQMKDPGDLNHRDLILLQRTKLDSLPKDYAFTSISPSYFLPTKRPFLNLPELSVISLQLIDLLQLSITPCNSCLHSPNTTLFDSGLLPSSPCGFDLRSSIALIGYSVCTNRCNIRRGIGSFLSMVTSHLLAVPNTESTNCYNLWLACLRHLQPLARHSLSF